MKNMLINLFMDLVKIDSVTTNEEKFSRYLLKSLNNLGVKSVLDKYRNIYGYLKGTGKPLFLSAHMDTVEPGKNIQPQVRGNYIVSDGTTILGADNKATIACILKVLELLKIKKNKHRTLEVIFTRSEEVGNYGAVNFDYSLLTSREGFCFDTNAPVGTIITASPYYERFDLEIIGKSAHAASPDLAINVLFIFRELINKIKLGKLDNETILNIGVIEGGHVRNTIPGKLNLAGEIRSFSEHKLLKHKKTFVNTLNKIVQKYKAKNKLTFVRENPGYKHSNVLINQLTPSKVERLIDTITQKMSDCGIKPLKKISWGVSDANIFNVKGLACVNLGDGVENAHTVKERVKISKLNKNVELIYNLLTK